MILIDPFSKRSLLIESTFPGVQIYSGNFIDPYMDRFKGVLSQHAGLAIEPQIVPNSIHNQEHPQAILKAGQSYHQEICYHLYRQPDLAFAGNCLEDFTWLTHKDPRELIAQNDKYKESGV